MPEPELALYLDFYGTNEFAEACVMPFGRAVETELRKQGDYGDPDEFVLPAKFLLRSKTSEPTASLHDLVNPEQFYHATIFIKHSIATAAVSPIFKELVSKAFSVFRKGVKAIVGLPAWRGSKPDHIKYTSDTRPLRFLVSLYFAPEKVMLTIDNRSAKVGGFDNIESVTQSIFEDAKQWLAKHPSHKPFLYYRVVDGVYSEPENLASFPAKD